MALLVFVVCCLFCPGGLLTSWHAADVSYYGQLGAHLRDGEIPYRDLYVEYPPGALPIFLLPAVSEAHYVELFKVLMTLLGAAAIVATAVAATALGVVGATARARGRSARGGADPARVRVPEPLRPLADAAHDRRARRAACARGRSPARSRSRCRSSRRSSPQPRFPSSPCISCERLEAWFGEPRSPSSPSSAVTVLPFALLGPGGLAFSFYIQLTRHLEIESLAASILLAADRLGVYDARIVDGTPGSRDLAGLASDRPRRRVRHRRGRRARRRRRVVREGPPSRARFVAAFATALVGYVAFGKVLSPQYMVWLLPIVPLVGGRRGIAAIRPARRLRSCSRGSSSRRSTASTAEAPACGCSSSGTSCSWRLFVTLAVEVRRSSSVSAA